MKPVSIISIVYGALGIIWGTAVSMIIHLQATVIGNIPFPEEVTSIIDVQALIAALDNIWKVLFPFIFVIATIYIISGILHLTSKLQYYSLAYIAAILNIGWYVAYMIMIQSEMLPLIDLEGLFPQNLFNVMIAVGMVFNSVFYCGYPVFLIVFLSAQRRRPIN
jgi:hypothetical protein